MSDDERLTAIRDLVQNLPPLQSSLIEHHADALAAERDRLAAYARALERASPPRLVATMRIEHGVADLLATPEGEKP